MNGLQKKIICKALDQLEDLSEWENEFINDLSERSELYELTEKQNHQLNRIWEKLDA